jgi:hypothetical protein
MDVIAPPNVFAHWSMGSGLPFSIGALSAVDSTNVQVRFLGVENLPSLDYTTSCVRYRLRGTGQYFWTFTSPPKVWVRAAGGTQGWRDTTTFDHHFEVPFARIISTNSSEVVVETFVYRVKDNQNPNVTLGWFPAEPAAARVALTVVGTATTTTAVDEPGYPRAFDVRVMPNPVVRAAVFRLSMPARGRVRALILDVAGRQVGLLSDAEFTSGQHEIRWDGLASNRTRAVAGVYFLRLESENRRLTRRFVLLGGQQ